MISESEGSVQQDLSRHRHVCHITSVHDRDDARIFWKECLSLSKAGFEVTLIVADGTGNEVRSGVRIVDTGKPGPGRLSRFLHSWFDVYRCALKHPSDVYHFHDPELIVTGLLLKLRGHRVIYDIHEHVSKQILLKNWIPAIIRKPVAAVFGALETWASRRFDALVVPQVSMQESFGKLNERCRLIPNFAQVEEPIDKADHPARAILFHAGGLTAARGFHNMLEAMKYLDKRCELHLAGTLESENYRELLRSHPLAASIFYHGRLPYGKVAELYRKTHIGIILYNNVGQYHLSWAVKLFEYMAHGIPVIMPNFGSWPDFNREHGCGVCVDPVNARQVAGAVHSLLDNPRLRNELGENGRRSVRLHYNWAVAAERLVGLYRDLLTTGQSTGAATS